MKLNEIRIDGGTQTRELINESKVAEYAEAYMNGDRFPPIEVFDDGVHKWLVDGFHRYFMYKRVDVKDVDVIVKKGTRREAQWYALSVNHSHGLPRSSADKRKAVMIALSDIEDVCIYYL